MPNPLVGDFYPEGIHDALGKVVVLWSNIEKAAGHAILTVGFLEDLFAAQVLVANMDIRAKLSALKAICFSEMKVEDFPEAERWISHIDGDLRNHRNRLIHDEWNVDILEIMEGHTHATRSTKKTKIIQKPPTGQKTLQTHSEKAERAENIIEFCRDLADARTALEAIRWYSVDRGYSRSLPPLAWRHKCAPQHPISDHDPNRTHLEP